MATTRKKPGSRRTRKRTKPASVALADACGAAVDVKPYEPESQRDAVSGDGAALASDEAVRVEVRPGEVVITVRTSALQPGSAPSLISPVIERIGIRAAEPAADTGRVGLTKVPADKLGEGYPHAWIRADLRDEYLSVLQKVRALGGILTSSGAIRELTAGVTPGRSRTSFHYTGRAIDLYIYSGMQGANDRYLVQRDGGTKAHPEWKVMCVSVNPLTTDPHYDASMLQTGEIEYLVWKKGTGVTARQRHVTCFSLTDVLARSGWVRIPARADWVTSYTSLEWWHFQHHKGLVDGMSLFGDELRTVWPADKVQASGLALNAVFAGRSFRA